MIPKGTAIIIGGAEDKGDGKSGAEEENRQSKKFEILRELIPQNSGRKKIEIITTASDTAAEIQKMYRAAFKKLHFSEIGFIDINEKAEARLPAFCERVHKAHSVLFSGGDQFKLS